MTVFDTHSTLAYSIVATGPGTSGLSLAVTPGDGAKFAFPQNATVWPINTLPTKSNAEIVRITGISGDTLTIVRAQEGTTAQNITAGFQIANGVTSKTLTDIEGKTVNQRGPWTQNTIYAVNDEVQMEGASFICLVGHTSSNQALPTYSNFQVDFFTNGYWLQVSARQQWFDVRDFGARIDNATNDTTAINNAILAAYNAGGGQVYIPAGTTLVTQVVLQTGVSLIGAGMWSTFIKALSNTNQPTVINHVSTNGGSDGNAMWVSLRDLQVNGHRAGTGGGSGNTSTTAHGVFFTTNPLNSKASGDVGFDTHMLLENVYIDQCPGWGFFQTGRSETRLINVYVDSCAQGGISPSYDAFLSECSVGACGGPGFSFTHGDIMVTSCKSFLSGHVNVGTPSNQPGFYISGTTLSLTMAGCIAQNNNGAGFSLVNANGVNIQGCSADSNNYGTGNTNSQYAGVELSNASNCIVDFAATQGFQSGSQIGNQYNSLRITGGSDHNDIRFVGVAAPGYTLGPLLTSDSVLLNNRIVGNGTLINPLPTLVSDADVSIASPANGQVLTYSSSLGKWVNSSSAAGSFAAGVLGDGSDGAAVLDGTATVPWASLSGGVYTMGRDTNVTNLTINSGVTLVPTGYRIFAQGTITNNGTISANGASATSSTGASAATSRSLASGSKGGNGATGTGSTGNNSSGGVCTGSGGGGGAGSSGSGGGAGNTLVPTSLLYMLRIPEMFASGTVAYTGAVNAISGGSGGGGGGGDGTNAGGGAGAGGNVICIFCNSLTNNGTIQANGGNGFSPAAGNTGGGGGGGGGLVVIFSIFAITNSGSITMNGGSGGTAHGTGANGSNGNNGVTLNVILQ